MTVSSEDEGPADSGRDDPVAEAILALLAETGAGRSISPRARQQRHAPRPPG